MGHHYCRVLTWAVKNLHCCIFDQSVAIQDRRYEYEKLFVSLLRPIYAGIWIYGHRMVNSKEICDCGLLRSSVE